MATEYPFVYDPTLKDGRGGWVKNPDFEYVTERSASARLETVDRQPIPASLFNLNTLLSSLLNPTAL